MKSITIKFLLTVDDAILIKGYISLKSILTPEQFLDLWDKAWLYSGIKQKKHYPNPSDIPRIIIILIVNEYLALQNLNQKLSGLFISRRSAENLRMILNSKA